MDKHLVLFLLWWLGPKFVFQQCLVVPWSHEAQSDFRSLELKDFGKFHINEAQTYKFWMQLWCFFSLSFELTFVQNKKELYLPVNSEVFLSFEDSFMFVCRRSGFGCLWLCERVLLFICYLNPVINFSKLNTDKYICTIWKKKIEC